MKLAYKNFNSTRRFGIELEFSNKIPRKTIAKTIGQYTHRNVRLTKYAMSYRNDYWHVKSDASCGSSEANGLAGVEVATYVCSGLKDLRHVSSIIKKIKEQNVEINDNCGLHVHVDVSDFDEDDLGRLILNWYYIEKIFIFSLPESRWQNKYCKFLNHSEKNWILPYLYCKSKNFSDVARFLKPKNDNPISETLCKRSSVNIVNFYRDFENDTNIRKTVEFRCPEGTISCDDVKFWAILFVNFVDYIKSSKRFSFAAMSNKKQIQDMFRLFGLGQNKTFHFYDKNLYNLKIWLLKRFLKQETSKCSTYAFDQIKIKKQARTLLDMIYKV